MNHQEYRERILLMLYDELSEQERRETEEHLRECAACRSDLEQFKAMHRSVDAAAPSDVPDELLREARQDLRGALRTERSRQPGVARRAVSWIHPWVPDYRIAVGLAAALAVGVFSGYLMFAGHGTVIPNETPRGGGVDGGPVEISNVRFLDADTTGDGQIEFAFDAVRPMRVRGRVDDPRITEILTHALLREQNPGVRLRAVNTVRNTKPEPDIEEALITSLKFDDNAGVRKEALSVLQRYPYNKEVRDAFLYVLQYDTNPALRIEAIKSLELKNATDDQDVRSVLDKMQSDDNNYIRRAAETLLRR
jgi:hypothetical protein